MKLFKVAFFLLLCMPSYAQLKKEVSNKQIASIFNLEKIYLNNAGGNIKDIDRLSYLDKKILSTFSDFYAGKLWLTYEYTRDTIILKKAKYATASLKNEHNFVTDPNIGFKIYCSYGNGYRITKDPKYAKIIIDASDAKIMRDSLMEKLFWPLPLYKINNWNFSATTIGRSNLQLLLCAGKLSGDSTYYQIAINHANTMMENQYQANVEQNNYGSKVQDDFREICYLYDFTAMYKYTNEMAYLECAENIASHILNTSAILAGLASSSIIYPTTKDVSAWAILASAFMQLSQISPEDGKEYFNYGERILKKLSSPTYLNTTKNGNSLLKCVVKNNQKNESQIDADYYFLEALLRYQQATNKFKSTSA